MRKIGRLFICISENLNNDNWYVSQYSVSQKIFAIAHTFVREKQRQDYESLPKNISNFL